MQYCSTIPYVEKRGYAGFGVLEFSQVGIPLTLINLLIYAMFIIRRVFWICDRHILVCLCYEHTP